MKICLKTIAKITIRFHKDNLRHHPRFPLISLAYNRFSLCLSAGSLAISLFNIWSSRCFMSSNFHFLFYYKHVLGFFFPGHFPFPKLLSSLSFHSTIRKWFSILELFCFCMSLRSSEIILFWNLQLFYWHFLEILWIFIFLVFYFSWNYNSYSSSLFLILNARTLFFFFKLVNVLAFDFLFIQILLVLFSFSLAFPIPFSFF